jgi:membrane-associated phospholipid phosphatase
MVATEALAGSRPLIGGFRARAAALLVGSLLILVGISPLVDGDKVPAFEETFSHFLNHFPGFLYWPLWPFMQVGNFIVIPIVFVVLLVMRRWKAALGVALIGVGKLYLGRLVKHNVVRHRPAVILNDVLARDNSGAGQAFVSGHVVVAFALAALLHPYVGRRARIALWTLCGVVSFARIYVGAHLALDVVGGAALGCAIAGACHLLLGPPKTTSRAT